MTLTDLWALRAGGNKKRFFFFFGVKIKAEFDTPVQIGLLCYGVFSTYQYFQYLMCNKHLTFLVVC